MNTTEARPTIAERQALKDMAADGGTTRLSLSNEVRLGLLRNMWASRSAQTGKWSITKHGEEVLQREAPR